MKAPDERDAVPAAAAPRPQPAGSAPAPAEPAVTSARITGIDLARSLAIFGMFAVHVGPTEAEGWLGGLYAVAHGRASMLFMVIAGVGVSLLAASPRISRRRARGFLLWRAALLLPLGLALQELDHGAAVILQVYAVLFLVAIPALRLPDRGVLGLAGAVATLGSAGFLWGSLSAPDVFDRGPVAWSDPAADILHGLVLSGPYPLITWLAPFLFGLWLGRRDLRSPVVRRRLLVVGTAVAVAVTVISRGLRAALGLGDEPTGWSQLALDTAHSQMPLWLIGSTAIAAVVLGVSLHLADAAPRLARPLVHTGQLALTAYVGHLLALHAAPGLLTADRVGPALVILLAFVAVSVVVATLWRAVLPRGPLEAVLHLPRWLG